MSITRRRPEDFLELVEKAKRGRLKVYLGFAAGVGKTYRMLEEAHTLKKRGFDVVIGLVEPHGRAETAALIHDLEIVPLQHIEYRGVSIGEMDLDAILDRRPRMVIVDEIAHTNAPTLRNRKRYQDVNELLDNGINVIAAFNVQHLESLNDLIARITGVAVRETVPDVFLSQADQVVTLDLAVEDLLERLKAGKIYGPDKVPWALEHFFKDENLTALRELVLREVAESLERTATPPAALEPNGSADSSAVKVMVCIASASPRAKILLRRGSRMAGRLNTNWYVVYVETPREAPHLIDAAAQRQLHKNIGMARELGAEVVRLKGHEPVTTILEFARTHKVGHILIGRSEQPWWKRLLGRDMVRRLIDRGAGFDVHIISFPEHWDTT